MMRAVIFFLSLIFFANGFSAQESVAIKLPEAYAKTAMAELKSGDSLLFYQCHVEEAITEITKANGEKIKGESKKISITEKFVVYNMNGTYQLKYYTSTLSNLPNRKFTYLKVKEKEYWNFKLEKNATLNEHDVLVFCAIEYKSHATTEYDFVVDKYNTNALIIRNKKVMKHLVVDGNHLLSKNLNVLN